MYMYVSLTRQTFFEFGTSNTLRMSGSWDKIMYVHVQHGSLVLSHSTHKAKERLVVIFGPKTATVM